MLTVITLVKWLPKEDALTGLLMSLKPTSCKTVNVRGGARKDGIWRSVCMYILLNLLFLNWLCGARKDGIWSQSSDLEEISRPLDLGANCLAR